MLTECERCDRRGFVLLGWVGGALLAYGGAIASAEAASPVRAGRGHRMEAVTIVGSKEGIAARSGSAASLGTGEIRTHGYDDINQVLAQVPGVYLRGEDGFGLFPNISLRGVDPGRSGKLTVMEDGVPTAPAPYSAPSAYYSPTTGRMSGIEVLKGSSQIRYGPHTTGGAINYLSTPIPTEGERYLNLLVGTDEEARAHTYVGDTVETAAGRIGYLVETYYRHNRGFKTIDEAPGVQSRERTGFDKVEPMIKISWEPDASGDQRFEAKFGYTDLDADETYLGLSTEDFREKPNRRYAASRLANIQTEHYRSSLRHLVQLSPALTVTTTGYYQHFHRNWFKLHQLRGPTQSLSEALADASGGLAILKGDAAGTLRYRNNDRDYYLAGIQSVAAYETELLNITHALSVGFRFHQDRVRRFQTDEDFTQDATGRFSARTPAAAGAGGNRKQVSQAYALFLEDRIEAGPLILTPGIRWEHVTQRFNDVGSGESGRDSLDAVAPGIGAVAALTDTLSVFGGVHRGFSVPGPRDNVKRALEEETSTGMELGSRYAHPRGIRAEAVLFLTDFDNLVVSDNIGGSGSEETENAGDIDVLGGEFSVGFDPAAYFGRGFRSPLQAVFTVTDAELDGASNSTDPDSIFAGGKDGNDVPYVPTFQFALSGGLENDRAGVFVNATYVGETFTSASNTEAAVNPNSGAADERFGKTDDRFVIDLSAHYRVREDLKAFVNFQNITDEVSIISRHPHGPRPGRPFAVTAGMELTF